MVDYNAKGGNGYTMFVTDTTNVVNTGVLALAAWTAGASSGRSWAPPVRFSL
jgi:hypothetical protein